MVLAKLLIPGASVVLAATPVVPADSTDKTSKSQPHRLRPSELPIYDADDGHCGCSHGQLLQGFPAKEKSALENTISDILNSADEYVGSLQSSKNRVIDFLETGKAHTLDTVAFLREESNLWSRVLAIVVGGLAGRVIARRGRKLIYTAIGASAAASVCYPNEAAQVTKSAYTISKYYAIVGYNKVQEELSSRKEGKEQPKPVSNVNAVGEQKTLKPSVAEQPKKSSTAGKSELKGDYGQSNPEDRDLYTTRGK